MNSRMKDWKAAQGIPPDVHRGRVIALTWCPACKAERGASCKRFDGSPRIQQHRLRWQVAANLVRKIEGVTT